MAQLHYIMVEIRERFRNSDMTQRILARLTGTVQSHISELLNEGVDTDKNPTIDLVTRLANVFNLHVALVDDEGNVVAAPSGVLKTIETRESPRVNITIGVKTDNQGRYIVFFEDHNTD